MSRYYPSYQFVRHRHHPDGSTNSQSVFSEGWSNAQAVAQLPESPPTQGDIQWNRNPPYDPEGDPHIFYPTVAGPYGPGQPLPMSGNEGCGVLDQPRHQSWDSYALGDSMSPPLIPETPGDPLSSIGHQAHQFGPLGGPSAMVNLILKSLLL
ncbi:hypothetical protein SCLCIDRAFT_794551 [Scleroderma citrinum Foug A]|uniref:Uncharacterized protein n=1 Tax=Scleroderma citrinum Foug A TaxID=1036808 RepID=A0A0C3D369_9AGAM|nr:hypothetical protein SCLCIDRAFT_794551 [Scleroderma citrinum Foug A]